MLGGLARRVALVEAIRSKEGNVVVVDSGDLFFDRKQDVDKAQALSKAEIIARAYKKMGVDAINVGDLDLTLGVEFLANKAREGLPLISANLIDAPSGKLLFPPYKIKEVGSLRVAFVGLFGLEVAQAAQKATENRVTILDPWTAARKTLEELRGKADLVLFLSDMGMARDQRLAKEVEGIHFILGGHDGRFMSFAQQESVSWLLQSYSKGMYLGKLKLKLEELGQPIQDEARVVRLQQEISKLDGRIDAHKKAKERGSNPSLDRSIAQLEEQRASLLKELEEAKTKGTQGNRFSWQLVPLDPSLPEDEEVARWIREAGIEKD